MKSVDGDHTFDDEGVEQINSHLGGVANTRILYRRAHGSKKKSERRNAWECRFLEIEEVPSGNNENAIK